MERRGEWREREEVTEKKGKVQSLYSNTSR